MKNIIVILAVIFLFNVSVYSQEETLINQGNVVHGGFGGPVVKFTSVNKELGILVGGRGGWIIDHTFVIGGGGYGLSNNISSGQIVNGKNMYLNFGYGGFEMEYITNWDKLVHASFYLLIGGGGVNLKESNHDMSWNKDTNSFFVLEPAVNVELNIVKFFRINFGASYRFISGVDSYGLQNNNLAGPSAMLTLKFGKF